MKVLNQGIIWSVSIMIKELLLSKILKNRIVFFENDGEYHLINDIFFDEGVMICKYVNREKED